MAEPLPVPTIVSITAQRLAHDPNVCDVAGGTIVAIVGTGFISPVEVRIRVAGAIVTDLEGKVAAGFVWDADRNVTSTLIYAGMPSLSAGTYDVTIATDGGVSNIVTVTYQLYSEDHRVLSVRQKFAKTWRTGARFLRR